MNHFSPLKLLFLAVIFGAAKSDDLLNARCQSKCLADFETRVQDNNQLKKQLKHQIINLCKEDDKCSSCLLPCRDFPLDNTTCHDTACVDALSPEFCRESCNYIVEGIKKRPGECPASIPVSLDECSAACDRDGDCAGSEKCCTTGCSRLCVKPIKSDKRLLPAPEGITVQERKRKRSAVVRWVMKRLSKQHMATNSNLYVIQWKWGTRRDESAMTPWQTIMVKNKMYAILKHLLMPGRYYMFRVASVNQYGSLGFSKGSGPFKLSKEVKAPLAPKNLAVETMVYDDDSMKWVPKLSWTPPASELPIKDYQLSWWKSTVEFANAYEQRTGVQIPEALSAAQLSRRSTDDDDYSTIDESMEKSLRSSTIIPSHATKTQLFDGLDPENVYMIELFATVDSTEGELKGEPAVIFVKTNSTMMLNDAESVRYDVNVEKAADDMVKPTRLMFPKATERVVEKPSATMTAAPVPAAVIKELEIIMTESELTEPRFDLDIRTPYFEGGKLKTSVSWIDSPACSPSTNIFAVRLTPKRCDSSQMETRLTTVTQCVVVVDSLNFNCEYEIEVDDVQTRKVISKAMFQTLPCENTPSTEVIACSGTPLPRPTCLVMSPTRAVCQWTVSDDPSIIGYRTILSSATMTSKIGVASALSPKMEYEDLAPGTDYRFRLQPVTNHGLNQPVDFEFSTKNGLNDDEEDDLGGPDEDKTYSRRLDKFPILELPLESSSPPLYSSLSFVYTVFLLMFLRIWI